jgi:hypothetical protein
MRMASERERHVLGERVVPFLAADPLCWGHHRQNSIVLAEPDDLEASAGGLARETAVNH